MASQDQNREPSSFFVPPRIPATNMLRSIPSSVHDFNGHGYFLPSRNVPTRAVASTGSQPPYVLDEHSDGTHGYLPGSPHMPPQATSSNTFHHPPIFLGTQPNHRQPVSQVGVPNHAGYSSGNHYAGLPNRQPYLPVDQSNPSRYNGFPDQHPVLPAGGLDVLNQQPCLRIDHSYGSRYAGVSSQRTVLFQDHSTFRTQNLGAHEQLSYVLVEHSDGARYPDVFDQRPNLPVYPNGRSYLRVDHPNGGWYNGFPDGPSYLSADHSGGTHYSSISSQQPILRYAHSTRIHYLGVQDQQTYVLVEHRDATFDVLDLNRDFPVYYPNATAPYVALPDQDAYFPVHRSDGSLYNGNRRPYLPLDYPGRAHSNGIPTDPPFDYHGVQFTENDQVGILDDTHYDFSDDDWWIHELLVHAEGSSQSGLSGETISQHLGTRTHVAVANQEPEICVICQVEYEDDETIGSLQCGHEYHADCIKKWLLQENVCPLCRATALKL
ncbi:hypothetical protein RJ639_041555 [Escallonia herrerae]|uniref:RING-type E3 ubiquitin transferase n=1 Tax=Escallonia herrerae TaxID=1293975 RepID=A0AA88WFV8_9ASTE|nr:hypothetical protein RJ639_041555 [Escallonia herrerae]